MAKQTLRELYNVTPTGQRSVAGTILIEAVFGAFPLILDALEAAEDFRVEVHRGTGGLERIDTTLDALKAKGLL